MKVCVSVQILTLICKVVWSSKIKILYYSKCVHK